MPPDLKGSDGFLFLQLKVILSGGVLDVKPD
jgi:hypothetical protein